LPEAIDQSGYAIAELCLQSAVVNWKWLLQSGC